MWIIFAWIPQNAKIPIMASSYSAQRRVEFSDTDMAGIMHFSNFFRFMETAEHGFLRSLGFSVVTRQTNPPVGWPRVHCECDFFKPVYFEDLLNIQLKVVKKTDKTLKYEIEFYREKEPDVLVAKGYIVAVCVTRDESSGKMISIPIPEEITKKIGKIGD